MKGDAKEKPTIDEVGWRMAVAGDEPLGERYASDLTLTQDRDNTSQRESPGCRAGLRCCENAQFAS